MQTATVCFDVAADPRTAVRMLQPQMKENR